MQAKNLMSKSVPVKLPAPRYADADLIEFLNQNQGYTMPQPGIDIVSNAFVSHYGLVSKYGVLNRHCMPNQFPSNDIPQFWNFQKEVAFQEAVCRFGSSMKVRNLGPEFTYLLIHHKWFGYFFWMTCYLPRLLRALNSGLSGNTKLLVSKRWIDFGYVAGSLATVNIAKEYLDLDEHAFVSKLLLPHARSATSHIDPDEIQRVVEHFTQAFPGPAPTPYRKVWIHRSETGRRHLGNEKEVLDFLNAHGFELLVLENLSLKEQILVMRETKILAGLHGAGLTNLMFLPKGATVLEFMPEDFAAYAHPFPYQSLAQACQVNYAVSGMSDLEMNLKRTKPSKANPAWRQQLVNANKTLSITKLRNAIAAISRQE